MATTPEYYDVGHHHGEFNIATTETSELVEFKSAHHWINVLFIISDQWMIHLNVLGLC